MKPIANVKLNRIDPKRFCMLLIIHGTSLGVSPKKYCRVNNQSETVELKQIIKESSGKEVCFWTDEGVMMPNSTFSLSLGVPGLW